MIIYPVTFETIVEDGCEQVRGTFPDIPGFSFIGFEMDDAIGLAPQRLLEALTNLRFYGRPMPLHSPIPEGGMGVVATLIWR